MSEKKFDTIEVICPKCGAKSERYVAMLTVCVAGCPECRCMWKHELMVRKEQLERDTN